MALILQSALLESANLLNPLDLLQFHRVLLIYLKVCHLLSGVVLVLELLNIVFEALLIDALVGVTLRL